jgi:hypothetical protein
MQFMNPLKASLQDMSQNSYECFEEIIASVFRVALPADMWHHVVWWIIMNVSKKLLPPSSEWHYLQICGTM